MDEVTLHNHPGNCLVADKSVRASNELETASPAAPAATKYDQIAIAGY
ncbi:hypothetical protein [Novosphingobium sp. UBA1939]|nr:hypothetical protein [Novosphingobium sp. UBA1939]